MGVWFYRHTFHARMYMLIKKVLCNLEFSLQFRLLAVYLNYQVNTKLERNEGEVLLKSLQMFKIDSSVPSYL